MFNNLYKYAFWIFLKFIFLFKMKIWDWIHYKAPLMNKSSLPCQTTTRTFQALSSKECLIKLLTEWCKIIFLQCKFPMPNEEQQIFKIIFLYLHYKCYEVYRTYSVAFSHWVVHFAAVKERAAHWVEEVTVLDQTPHGMPWWHTLV